MLLRKVNGTAIIQLPSKRQMQVCVGYRWEGSAKEEFLECTFPGPHSSQVFYVRHCPELGLPFRLHEGITSQVGTTMAQRTVSFVFNSCRTCTQVQ